MGSGHFYATLPCGALGLLPDGAVRASIAHYTSPEDVRRFLELVRAIAASAASEGDKKVAESRKSYIIWPLATGDWR